MFRISHDKKPILSVSDASYYEQLIRLLHDRDSEEHEKIQQIERCLRQNPGPAVLHSFLLEIIAYSSNPLLIDTVLKKGIDPSVLTAVLDQQLAEECPPSAALIHSLLQHGADPNTGIAQGNLSLLQRVLKRYADSAECPGIVAALLHHGADLHWQGQVFQRKASPEARAREEGEYLVEALSDAFSGLSPCFAEGGEEPLTLWDLIDRRKRQAEEPLEDYQPRSTALHYACSEASPATFTLLLEAKADLDAQDAEGNTPLHTLMQERDPTSSDYTSIVRALLGAKASPIIQNRAGDTPLHTALNSHFKSNVISEPFHSLEAIESLIEAKADVALTNQKGDTALHQLMRGMERWISTPFWGFQVLPQALLLVDSLVFEETMPCLSIPNREGVTPQDFFSRVVIPPPLAQRVRDALEVEEVSAGPEV